jgi:alpha-L-fucosidase
LTQYEPDWDSLHQYRVPGWFSEAKFGIFLHWGISSIPAMFDAWYPSRIYQKDSAIYEYHRETYRERFGDKDFILEFKAEKFNPMEWAILFHESAAHYGVAVNEYGIFKKASACIRGCNHPFSLEEV